MDGPSTSPSQSLAVQGANRASPTPPSTTSQTADAAPATLELKPHSPPRATHRGAAAAAAASSSTRAVGSTDGAAPAGAAAAEGPHRQSVSPQVVRIGSGAPSAVNGEDAGDGRRSLAGSQKYEAASGANRKEAVMPPPPAAAAGAYSPPGGAARHATTRQHRRVPPPTDAPYEFLSATGAPLRHQHAPATGPTVGQALASHFRTRSSWAGSEVLSTVERYLNGVYRPPVPSVFAKRAAGGAAAGGGGGGPQASTQSHRRSSGGGGDFSPSGGTAPHTTAARDYLLPATFLSAPNGGGAAAASPLGGSPSLDGAARAGARQQQRHNNQTVSGLATFGAPASPLDHGDAAAASAPALLLRRHNGGANGPTGSLPERALYSDGGGGAGTTAARLSLSASGGTLTRARSAAAAAADDSVGHDGATGCPNDPVSYAQSFGRRLRTAARVGREAGLAAAAAALFRRWPSAPAPRSSPSPVSAGGVPGTDAAAQDDEALSDDAEITAPLTPTNRRRPIPMIPDVDVPSAPPPPPVRVLSMLDGQTGQPVPVWSATCSIPVPQPSPVFVSSSPSSPSSPRSTKNATKPLVFLVTTTPVSAVTRMGHGSVSARGACGVLMTSATTVREAVTRLPEAKCPSLHPALTAALSAQIEALLAGVPPPLGSPSALRSARNRPPTDLDGIRVHGEGDGIRVHDGAAPMPRTMSPSALRDQNPRTQGAAVSAPALNLGEGAGLVSVGGVAGTGAGATGHALLTSPTDAAGAAFAQLTSVTSPPTTEARLTVEEILQEDATTTVPAPPLVPLVAFTAAVCGSVPQLRAAMADVRTALGPSTHNYQPMPPPAPVEGLGLTPANDGTPEDAFTAAAVAARADWMWPAPAAAVALGTDAPQRTLMSMGFDRRHADAALCLARGSLPAACALLTDSAWRVDEFLSGAAVGADASGSAGAAASPGAGSVSSPMAGISHAHRNGAATLPSPHPHPTGATAPFAAAGGYDNAGAAGSSDAAAVPPAVSTPAWDQSGSTYLGGAAAAGSYVASTSNAFATTTPPPLLTPPQQPDAAAAASATQHTHHHQHLQLEAATSTVRLPSDEEAYLFAVVSGRAREAPPAPAAVDGEAWLAMLQEYVRASCGRHPQCGSLTSALAQGVVTPELVVETALLALQAPMEFHKLRLCGTRAHRILMLQWCRMFAEAAPGAAS